MWHRRFLLMDHWWSSGKRLFDGTQEMNPSPIVSTADETTRQLGGVEGYGEKTEDWSPL
jgi:hypothetical protein